MACEVCAERRDIGPGPAARDDHRDRALAGARIGHADDRDFRDPRMAGEQVLDLLGADVLAVADDDVLDPPGDDQMIAIEQPPLIPGAVEPGLVERGGLVLGVDVTDQHLRPRRTDFAVLGDAHLGDPGAAVGLGGAIYVGAVDHPDGGHRNLGRAIDPADDGIGEVGARLADQGGRNRGPAADEQFQVGQPCARRPRGTQQRRQERSRSRHVGDLAFHHHRHRDRRIPLVHQHGGRAEQQRGLERIDRAADVADRRGHQKAVARLDQPVRADLADQRVERIVRVEHAFGPPGGAAGIHHHAHLVGIERRQRDLAGILEQPLERREPPRLAAHHHHFGRR